MESNKLVNKIPLLPLSALVFYLIFLILWKINIVPSPTEIINLLEGLYHNYGLLGLFVAAFFEGLVYFGLYFAGSTIILFIVLFSDGKIISLLNISIVVTLALTITSIINYVLGRHFVQKSVKKNERLNNKKHWSKGLVLSSLHPNALAFYFLNAGLKKKEPWQIILVPVIMVPYGFLIAYLIYLIKPFIERNAENPYATITILLTWFVIALIVRNKK